MKKIAIFASGNGSNFQALVDAKQAGKLRAEINLLVCDKPGAFVIERAEKAGIPTFVFNPKDYDRKEQFEQLIAEQLKQRNIEYVILAGYMRLIGQTLLDEYPKQIINIHPSLLPSFPGIDAVDQAIAAGVKVTGVTIHFVDEGMDTGPIIAQRALEIKESETKEEIEKNIHAIEHVLYPETLNKLFATEANQEGKER